MVAGEVRSLAQRSAQAANEIKSLISTSVQTVDVGAKQVNGAGKAMQDTVDSAKRVGDIIGEITAASAEQSMGIGQVNQAVGDIDRMTQQNAALVEESAAAAESLREQAARLAQLVSQFKLGEGAQSMGRVARAKPQAAYPAMALGAAASASHALPGKKAQEAREAQLLEHV